MKSYEALILIVQSFAVWQMHKSCCMCRLQFDESVRDCIIESVPVTGPGN